MLKILYGGFIYESREISGEMKRLSVQDISIFKNINEYLNTVSYNKNYVKISRIENDIKRKIKLISLEITKKYSNNEGKVIVNNEKTKEIAIAQAEGDAISSNMDDVDEAGLLPTPNEVVPDTKTSVKNTSKKEDMVLAESEDINTKNSNTMRKISDLYKVFLYNIYSYNLDFEKYLKDLVEKSLFDKEFNKIPNSYSPPNPKYIESGYTKGVNSAFNDSEHANGLVPIHQILTSNTPVRFRNEISYDVVSQIYLNGLFKEVPPSKIINIPVRDDNTGLALEIENLITEATHLINLELSSLKQDYIKKTIEKIESSISSNEIKNKDILTNIDKLKQGNITSEQFRHLVDSLKLDISIPKSPTINAMATVKASK